MSKNKKLETSSRELISKNFKAVKKMTNLFRSTEIGLIKGIYRYHNLQVNMNDDEVFGLCAECLISTKNFPPFEKAGQGSWHDIILIVDKINIQAKLFFDIDDEEDDEEGESFVWSKSKLKYFGLSYKGSHPVIIELNEEMGHLKLYHFYNSFKLDVIVKRFLDPKDKPMLKSIANAENCLSELAYKEVAFWQDEDIQSCFNPSKSNTR